MIEAGIERDATAPDAPRRNSGPSTAAGPVRPSIPEQYGLLLAKLGQAERELEAADAAGRTTHIEEASALVFDLLYNLDFKHGGELVPRLAGLYGYLANELLNVGRTGDLSKIRHVRDMISALKRSWEEDGQAVGKKLPLKNEIASPILDGGGK